MHLKYEIAEITKKISGEDLSAPVKIVPESGTKIRKKKFQGKNCEKLIKPFLSSKYTNIHEQCLHREKKQKKYPYPLFSFFFLFHFSDS